MNLIDRILAHYRYYRKPSPEKKRICFVCGKQIKRNHRWHKQNGLTAHLNCQNPIGKMIGMEDIPL